MKHIEVEALQGFEHYGTRCEGDRWSCSELHARELKDAGLVCFVDDAQGGVPVGESGKEVKAVTTAATARKRGSKPAAGAATAPVADQAAAGTATAPVADQAAAGTATALVADQAAADTATAPVADQAVPSEGG